jgi:hypothetical protein
LRRLINSTVSDVSRKHGLGEEAIEGMLDRPVAREVDWTRFTALEFWYFHGNLRRCMQATSAGSPDETQ